MIVVTDAYLADVARQDLDGKLHVEGDHLDRLEIGPNGTVVITMVVHHRRPKIGGPSWIKVDVVYPWGGGGREQVFGLSIEPQAFIGQEGFVFFTDEIDAPVEGDYKLVAQGSWGDPVTVPVTFFKQP